MKNNNTKLLILLIAMVILISWGLTKNYNEQSILVNKIHVCKEDSLKQEIYKLQAEIKSEEDGWDHKEQLYEDILFEYEYGVEHLKQSHPDAYREFHRIVGYKEKYTRETERENKKRLNTF